MEFKLNASNINTNTVAIVDHRIVSDKLAKIVIAFTGNHTRQGLTRAIAEKFDNRVAVVESSFRQIGKNSAVGFIRANTEIRVGESEQQIRAGYKVMSSNILMDKKDESLWEVRKGAGGKYLARHGNEDLSELVNAHTTPRTDVPKLAHIAMASAANNDFVAFVGPAGDMDYGFATGVKADGTVRVLSSTTKMDVTVPSELITASFTIDIPKELHHKVMASLGLTPGQKAKAKEYWTALYSYDPAYLELVKQQVDQGTTA